MKIKNDKDSRRRKVHRRLLFAKLLSDLLCFGCKSQTCKPDATHEKKKNISRRKKTGKKCLRAKKGSDYLFAVCQITAFIALPLLLYFFSDNVFLVIAAIIFEIAFEILKRSRTKK